MLGQNTQAVNIETELNLLKPVALTLIETEGIVRSYVDLKKVNQLIWDSMERLFKIPESDVATYASEAHLATSLNIERAKIKRKIDMELNSLIKEAKSYF